VDLNYYNLSISGTDFAGHQGSDQLLNLRADTTPPSAPSTMDYEYHGYANEIRSASAAGGANEFLRVYITGDPSSPYTAMYPGPYSIGDTIISGLSAPVAGRAIQYCMVKFGNESSLIADGNIPTPLTGADANLLAVEWDNAYTDYQVNASALPSTLNEGDSIYAHSSVNPTELSWVASITSMTWMMFSDAIPSASIMPGAQISYTYKDTNGNYAGFTADGKIEALQAVDVVDVNTSGFVDTGDIIRLDFGAGNNVTVNAGLGTMQSGSPAIIGGYQWSGSLGELNVSLVSPTSAAEMFANFVAPSIVSSGSQYAEINLNDFSIMSVNNIDQVAVEIHPKGTNSIRGEDGGHLVLPSSMITSNGTTGGIVTPDF
jgi:hypothetical protein